MKLISTLPFAAGLAVGYVLGTAAGRGRYRQITSAARRLVHHPKVQEGVFDAAAKAQANAHHLPRPVASLVDTAATRVEDKLTQPSGPAAGETAADSSPEPLPASDRPQLP